MFTSARAVTVAVALGVAIGACGGAQGNTVTQLTRAKSLLDAASSAHFMLSSSGARSDSSVTLLGGTGDIQRPDGFSGTLTIVISGFTTTVDAASTHGTFYIRNPLDNQFETADPTQYGFADPAKLMAPTTGLSSLLLKCSDVSEQGDDRLAGQLLHELSCSLPGSAVQALLTDAAPDQTVSAKVGVVADSGELRRVVLTGPFYSSSTSTTFTLVVDNYGENVTITPPATGS
ncbi:MAG: LppX_LprAFG lipoprotein [Candidatus Dormibacteria bacterium]